MCAVTRPTPRHACDGRARGAGRGMRAARRHVPCEDGPPEDVHMLKGMRIAYALTALLVTTPAAAAKPMKPDCEASLPAVQVAVAAECDCAAATNHGQYVRCAGTVVKAMVAADTLGKTCKGAMVRVFAKSSCGKPDAVTC